MTISVQPVGKSEAPPRVLCHLFAHYTFLLSCIKESGGERHDKFCYLYPVHAIGNFIQNLYKNHHILAKEVYRLEKSIRKRNLF